VNYIRKFEKNAQGLSPVVASIILIAVTVAVSVVVAAWMGGTTIGLMGNAEQATITNLGFNSPNAGDITVSIQNTGNAPVNVTQVMLNTQVIPAAQITFPNGETLGTFQIGRGQSSSFVINGQVLTTGSDYTVKLVSAKANNMVLTSTCP
jgi:flagellin-like protein